MGHNIAKRDSAVHSLGAGAGAALLLGGASRSGMTGSALARGVRQGGGNTSAVFAAQRYVRSATEPAVTLMHRSKGIGGYIDLVPARFRPALAMGLGASILHHELPKIRQRSY